MFFAFLDTPGGQSWSAHWAILWNAFCAAFLAGQMIESEFLVDIWDFEEVFSWLGSVGCSWAVISSGYSFTIGLFVLPLLVWIWAARIPVHHFPWSVFQQVLVSNAFWDLPYVLVQCYPPCLLWCYYQWFCDIHEGLSSNHASNETRSSVRARLRF